MVDKVCPACGGRTHHSHTRGLIEKSIRAMTSYKMYRCRECSWRGWVGKPNTLARKHRLRTIISLLITLLLTTLLALYLVERMSQPPPPAEPFILPSITQFI